MLHGNGKASCKLHFGQSCLIPHTTRPLDFVSALTLALALLVISAGVVVLTRQRVAESNIAAPLSPTIELTTPKVPQRPVEALERIDLSTVVRNPSENPTAKITVELDVLQPDGTRVMSARQSGLTLDANDSRAIFWSWRVPAQLGGTYQVMVQAFDANGRPLDADSPAATLKIIQRGD